MRALHLDFLDDRDGDGVPDSASPPPHPRPPTQANAPQPRQPAFDVTQTGLYRGEVLRKKVDSMRNMGARIGETPEGEGNRRVGAGPQRQNAVLMASPSFRGAPGREEERKAETGEGRGRGKVESRAARLMQSMEANRR